MFAFLFVFLSSKCYSVMPFITFLLSLQPEILFYGQYFFLLQNKIGWESFQELG